MSASSRLLCCLLAILPGLSAHHVPWHRPGWRDPRGFVLTHNYMPHNLLDGFQFMTAADYPGTGDPTGGFVNYVDRTTAEANGLTKIIGGKLFLGVDNTSVLETNVQGRMSLRLESKKKWSNGLLIADIAHMPGNECGVWPAFWTYNMEENPIAEIDIIEGISFQEDNIVSIHTGPECRFLPGWQTGKEQRANCALFDKSTNQTNYAGCGVTSSGPSSYGTAFNKVRGGVYATLLENQSIRLWHWPRHRVPRDILRGEPRPWSWGKPMGDMSRWNGGCDVNKTFHSQTIIINTDFCGSNMPDTQWQADEKCSMHPTCVDFVAKNPKNFTETYWLLNSIKVYERPRWPRPGSGPSGGPPPGYPGATNTTTRHWPSFTRPTGPWPSTTIRHTRTRTRTTPTWPPTGQPTSGTPTTSPRLTWYPVPTSYPIVPPPGRPSTSVPGSAAPRTSSTLGDTVYPTGASGSPTPVITCYCSTQLLGGPSSTTCVTIGTSYPSNNPLPTSGRPGHPTSDHHSTLTGRPGQPSEHPSGQHTSNSPPWPPPLPTPHHPSESSSSGQPKLSPTFPPEVVQSTGWVAHGQPFLSGKHALLVVAAVLYLHYFFV